MTAEEPEAPIEVPAVVLGRECPSHRLTERPRHLFVSVEEKDPRPGDLRMTQRPVALARPVIEGPVQKSEPSGNGESKETGLIQAIG